VVLEALIELCLPVRVRVLIAFRISAGLNLIVIVRNALAMPLANGCAARFGLGSGCRRRTVQEYKHSDC
jgi:hypothetical protein